MFIGIKQYIENIEKDEEKKGKDLDHDCEKGEPWKHAVKAFNNDLVAFAKCRQKGAKKIVNEAKNNQGTATPTFWHFQAKVKAYNEVISALKQKKNKKFFESKVNSLKQHINLKDQKQFQETVGELEVWGEIACQL